MNPERPNRDKRMIRVKDTSDMVFTCLKRKCGGTSYRLCFSCVDEGKAGLFPRNNTGLYGGKECDKCHEYFCDEHTSKLIEIESDPEEYNFSFFYCEKCVNLK